MSQIYFFIIKSIYVWTAKTFCDYFLTIKGFYSFNIIKILNIIIFWEKICKNILNIFCSCMRKFKKEKAFNRFQSISLLFHI